MQVLKASIVFTSFTKDLRVDRGYDPRGIGSMTSTTCWMGDTFVITIMQVYETPATNSLVSMKRSTFFPFTVFQ